MTEKPILFRTAMVKAILDGRKTQTRRVIKPQLSWCAGWDPPCWVYQRPKDCFVTEKNGRPYTESIYTNSLTPNWLEKIARWSPYGQRGGTLWVRETFARNPYYPSMDQPEFFYRADGKHESDGTWKPSIFMPRVACRIRLLIKRIRVERLQDISEADATAEGVQGLEVYPTQRGIFQRVWEGGTGKKYPWASNPWVWAIEFENSSQ